MKIESLSLRNSLPAVIAPGSTADQDIAELTRWLRQARPEWNKLLLDKGGILFRGFNLQSVTNLEQILQAVSSHPLNYIGGNSPRTRVSDIVYTSTEYPADQIITLHNELSYAQSWPSNILFWCDIPAAQGGETPIIDSRTALGLLPKSLVERFEAKGLVYLQTLHGGAGLGRSWQSSFETDDRSIVERTLKADGVDFEWNSAGALKIRYCRKAVETHPVTGEALWFCQADQWHPSSLDPEIRDMMREMVELDDFPHNVVFGDGSPIDEEDVRTIRNVLWDNAVAFPWRRGDLLLLDNMLVAHGRRSFTGSRKVYVTMA
jgi:alpha-ketoglutarate-dependent taurine dioxygenase